MNSFKIIFSCIIIINSFLGFAQSAECISKKLPLELKQEVDFFMDTVLKSYKEKVRYHIVFVSRFDSANFKCKKYQFTLGYIFNSHEMQYIKATHIMFYRNEYILLSSVNANIESCLRKNFDIHLISSYDSLLLKERLYPNFAISAVKRGLVYNRSRAKKIRTFFYNDDEIPTDKAIKYYYPKDIIIKKIDIEDLNRKKE